MQSTTILEGTVPLAHLGVVRVQGADAAAFLQGQLTNDIALLKDDEARLAAYLSAKGRMQASFVALRPGPDEVLLVVHRDLLAQTVKRLSMFVLRAKARLSDASADFVLCGAAGDTAARLLGGPSVAPWRRVPAEGGQAIALHPAAGRARALWIAPAGTPAPAGPPLAIAHWLWSEVRSGIATLSAPVVDAFVPQMLNYESVGGVSFKKGCYPGQEVVARSQFRGTLKRRAYLVHAEQAPEGLDAGDEVFHASDAEQPAGTVVQAAEAPGGGWDAIVSMQTAAAKPGDGDATALCARTPDGPALRLLELPYPLAEDI
ncbi:MAG: folate-binding protein [Xylophilus ampelinus]